MDRGPINRFNPLWFGVEGSSLSLEIGYEKETADPSIST